MFEELTRYSQLMFQYSSIILRLSMYVNIPTQLYLSIVYGSIADP